MGELDLHAHLVLLNRVQDSRIVQDLGVYHTLIKHSSHFNFCLCGGEREKRRAEDEQEGEEEGKQGEQTLEDRSRVLF